MKKDVAKIFREYGEGKIEMVRGYHPKADKKNPTTAIRGTRMDINKTIGRIILDGDKDERKLVAETLLKDYFEDWDSANGKVIKY